MNLYRSRKFPDVILTLDMENSGDFPEDLKPLKSGEVQKLILAKYPEERPDHDLKNFTGNYVDEDRQIYKNKQKQFREFVEKIGKFKRGWRTSKEIEEFMAENKCFPETPNSDIDYSHQGKRERRRLKPDPEETNENYCIEPWFKRHIILNKFIQCARGVILRNRMLKNLEKLRKLDEEKIVELESKHVTCTNESYAELFAKFL